MGCNCNKKKTSPLGPSRQAQEPRPTRTAGAMQQEESRQQQQLQQGGQQSFILTTRDGRTQTFGSRLEANAERIRSGGGHISVK